MLSDQWDTRRTRADPRVIQLEESVDVNRERLRFLTATPVLFPEWPIVQVEYRIEVDMLHRGVGRQNRKLVYEEVRVVDLESEPNPRAYAPGGGRLGAEITLIDDCAELAWERFGPSLETLERLFDDARGSGAQEASQSELGQVLDQPEESEREEPPEWRPIEPDYDYPTPAARLVGVLHQERFTWPILAAPLR